MFGFIKNMFVITMSFFSCNAIPLKCVSMNNQDSRTRPEIININSNESLFYPYSNSIEVSVVADAIISMIHMQNYVLLMLLKI